MSIQIAVAQVSPKKGDYRTNLARLGDLFAQLDGLEPRPQVLCLPESALTGYFLELHETTAGSHAFVSDGGVPVMLPSAPPTSTRVVAVDEHEGTDAGRFEPVWVVASGLRRRRLRPSHRRSA